MSFPPTSLSSYLPFLSSTCSISLYPTTTFHTHPTCPLFSFRVPALVNFICFITLAGQRPLRVRRCLHRRDITTVTDRASRGGEALCREGREKYYRVTDKGCRQREVGGQSIISLSFPTSSPFLPSTLSFLTSLQK